ncbi:2OG-Fe(II) oxygenase [Colletotrichum eremochloae]|nr:2OG-Fe(II) oxygenase [Colletotrichum eremochloae]
MDYECWKDTLRVCLKGIKSAGDIATFTRHTAYTNPGLKIEGHPAIPLPLTPEHAELIKGACRQAPFGKGNNTLVDTSVRNTWELENHQFELLNPEWPAFLVRVGGESARGLGLRNIALKPHKLLLYEKGSFFKRHKDTEKEPGMVGTLVVCLPSDHTGGDVHLSFGSEKRTYSTAPNSRFDLTTLAWYSDVSHEVKELEAGYRLALTYNIVVQNDSEKQSAGFFGKQARQIEKFLTEWQMMFHNKERLIHPLEHKYSQASLSMHNMKGRDGAVCRALDKVASECGVYLLLGHLTRSEGGYLGDDEDTYNNLTDLYLLDGKPIGRGDMPADEEILDLNKLSEGNPDSEEEGEYTGNEAAESTLRYHNTVVILIKKDRILHYVKPIAKSKPSGNVYTHNIIQMVTEDMEKLMKDRNTEGIAKPPLLRVLRKAFRSGETSKTLTPVAVYWAMTLEDSAIYKTAMTTAMKCSVQDIRGSAIKTAVDFIEQRFGDDPESIDWDKWVGSATEMDTLTGVQETISRFTPVFRKDTVKDSFVEWGECMLDKKLNNQAEFNISEHLFFIKTIEKKHNNKDWLMSTLIPALASRGTRELIYSVLHSVFVNKDQVEFSIAKELFEYVLHHGFAKLLLQGADLLPKPADSGPQDFWSQTRKPTHVSPTCSGLLKDFVAIVDHCLSLKLTEKGRELLEACCNQLAWTKAEWDPKKVCGDIISQLLSPIINTLKEHSVPHTQGVKDLFEVILREGLHANIPPTPPKRRGWSYEPCVCFRNHGGPGHKCKDCEALNAFLVAPDQKSWRYQAGKVTRDHLEDQLRSYVGGYTYDSQMPYFKITTQKTKGTHTLVVEKTEQEFADAVVSWQQSVRALDSRLVPLRTEIVAEMLGDKDYRELVMAEDLQAQLAASERLVPSGMKRAVDGAATAELPGAKKVRL